MRPGLRSQPGQARPEFSLVTTDGWLSCQDLSFISHRFQFHLCVCHLRNQKNGVLEINCLDANGSFPKIKQLVGNTSADTHCCALGERSGAALLALPALARAALEAAAQALEPAQPYLSSRHRVLA